MADGTQAYIQPSFNSGEWSPTLNARVDLQKYRSGAALLKNFFVDYRGGASTRPGTQYILKAWKSGTPVRLITFQASFDLAYVLELGDMYMRFFNQGAPILETALNITAASQTDPCVIEVVGNTYVVGEWIFISGVVGMTELNGKYFRVNAVNGNDISLGSILDDSDLDATGYSAYVSDGTAARIYTIPTPWLATDLAKLKFDTDVNTMRFVHPDYPPYVLTLIGVTNWTLQPVAFGTSISVPGSISATSSLSAGSVHYSYTVTAVDINGQESIAGTPGTLSSLQDIRTVAGSNTITWSAVTGAVSYNVYKAELRYGSAVPSGAIHGYIGNAMGTTFVDTNILQDFSTTPPLIRNPFQGAGVQSITVTNPGSYTTVPTVTLDSAPSGGVTAIATATLSALSGTISSSSSTWGSWVFGVTLAALPGQNVGALSIQITGLSNDPGSVTSFIIVNPGSITSGSVNNLISFAVESRSLVINFTFGITSINVISQGAGYTSVPNVTISGAGSGAGTAILAPSTAGNPSTIGVFQQRQVYGAPSVAPSQFNMSQPGLPNNFNVSNPGKPDDAIQHSLRSQVLNTIRWFIQVPSGLITLTDRAAWLLNAGQSNEAVTQANIIGNTHSYNGAADVPPIVANFDILYVQAKGSTVRNLSYNFYANVFTGTDITTQSSHLFYGYTVTEWAWAEEPFKVAWCVRDDGALLSLTFLKEQEFVAWAHSVTDGLFKSVTNAIEQSVNSGIIDSIYVCVEREIDGNTVQYIERMAERIYPNGVIDAWCVDSALEYVGPPETDFTGGEHLAGKTCTGVADGIVIEPFVMPADGNFTLPECEKAVVGLGYECDLQTLALDLGEPTVQGKAKSIPSVDVRVCDTLGLFIGREFGANMVPMKDLIVGNVSSTRTGMSSQIVEDLVTGDARTILDNSWTIAGQYCIRQSLPLPATILGVIPQIAIGDTTGGQGGRRSP